MYVFFVLGKQKESSDKVLVKGYDPCPIAFPVAIGDKRPRCSHIIAIYIGMLMFFPSVKLKKPCFSGLVRFDCRNNYGNCVRSMAMCSSRTIRPSYNDMAEHQTSSSHQYLGPFVCLHVRGYSQEVARDARVPACLGFCSSIHVIDGTGTLYPTFAWTIRCLAQFMGLKKSCAQLTCAAKVLHATLLAMKRWSHPFCHDIPCVTVLYQTSTSMLSREARGSVCTPKVCVDMCGHCACLEQSTPQMQKERNVPSSFFRFNHVSAADNACHASFDLGMVTKILAWCAVGRCVYNCVYAQIRCALVPCARYMFVFII